ncbi:MAG: aminotransferase class V-fold PLP-dependent enzyme, partial [Candidatus Andersenbacteria bacterium]
PPAELPDVYLDHAATTPLDPRVRAAMEPFWGSTFGNPSALYRQGREAKLALDGARERVAHILNCTPAEVIFTGSGTESDNHAILGIARAAKRLKKGNHIITTAVEHHAVLVTVESLQKEGFEITLLPVDEFGRVSPAQLAAALKPETVLVSIMYANNEVGTIMPIAELTKVTKAKRVPFHTDACQAQGALPLDIKALGVDALTINGSKIYGPKGVGALYVRRGLPIDPILHGGAQESSRRAGTENLANIVGLATALELAEQLRASESARLVPLRDRLIAGILKHVPKSRLNGHPTERLPNNVHVSILDIEGEALLLYLDEFGIAAATGSACDSQTLDPSHVVIALGLPYEFAHGSLRFTLGRSTTQAQVDYVVEHLPRIVEVLRAVSPLELELPDTVAARTKEILNAN